ncbi:hypothetical protein [Paenibacillus mesotrionivorans]|uniref:Uncharacterized protein n=1 Tax=Paenibacillus mesotrionivorans TaxID=3160968 RepID=A0ACC7NQC5_9BACL
MTKNQLFSKHKRIWSGALAFVLALAMLLPVWGNRAEAGKEGVFLDSNVYYTLEKVQLSAGSEKSSFRFTVELVNDSDYVVDMNQYGVAVRDEAGNRYGVELTEKISSRVPAHSTKQVKYSAKLPASVSLDQLKVEIYAWDLKVSGYIRSIGMLSVAAAAEASQTAKPSAIVALGEVDSSYATDALVNFELQRAYHAYAKDNWNVYAELTVENLGTGSFKLPTALQAGLKNAEGLTFSGSVVYGGDVMLLPHQKATVVLEFPVGELSLNGALSIDFSKKAATTSANSGNNASNGSNGTTASSTNASTTSTAAVLESLPIGGYITAYNQGELQADSSNRSGLTATIESVSVAPRADGVSAESVYTLKNDGSKAVSVPALTAFYQSNGSTLTVAAEDSASHPDYLAPGESTTYYYSGVLPTGIDSSAVQLVVMEAKSASVSVPVFVANLPADAGTGAPVESGSSIYATSVGKLEINLNASYRLKSGSGDDILMSEVQVHNLQSESVKLPALYGGYYDGKNTVDATVKAVQTSAYINAGQKATLYVFATVPYDMEMYSGKLILGEGTESGGTVSKKKEWLRVNYMLQDEAVSTVTLNNTWMVSDPSRVSTGAVVEVKQYRSLTKGDSSDTVAVRINQKNLMNRSGSVVPYVGYLETSNGEVYELAASTPTGKLNKDGQAMTTLYATLPFGVLDKNAYVVFGPQIKDQIFSPAHKYKISISSNQPGPLNGETWVINESVFPFNVKIGAMERVMSSGGYFFKFRYKLEKLSDTLHNSTNRSLYFEVEDAENVIVKTFDIPLEGTGSFQSTDDVDVKQSLQVPLSDIKDLDSFTEGNRIKVYEKFENAVRYLGEITINLN